MAYIYKITNNINNKIYIGKTIRSLEVRWREHQKDFYSGKKNNLPLYAAMKKYGIEHFHIEIIEECQDNIVSEREKYWIEEFQSFKKGYNATLGGDGKPYIDYDLVCLLYEQLQNQTKVAEKLNINRSTVRYILENRKIPLKSAGEIIKDTNSKSVVCFTKTGEFVEAFVSLSDAARFVQKQNKSNASLSSIITNIGRCKRGERQSAYDWVWK